MLILAIAAPTAAFAQVGTPSGGGDTISWDVPVSGHVSIEMRVSCAGDVQIAKTFRAGKPVTLSIRDFPGNSLEDGSCSYEMYTVPFIPPGVEKQLANARAAGNDKAATKILKQAGISSLYQSGGLSVLNGSFVALGGTESDAARTPSTDGAPSPVVSGPSGRFTPVTNDQVIPDDLIVQGSACVGLDCVNNENFGFDTIRMKENNTRIKFEDTSTSAGFPTTDWQLTANDSASGGSSKFSIEDMTSVRVPFTITGGANTNSIFVDSTGRIGARTSSPVLDFHIATSNTPAIRLEQNNSGGFTAQTWDIGANEANFFVRDVTSGSRLSFRIRPGAPTSSIDISADGDVGIGTGSPQRRLHVRGPNGAVTTFPSTVGTGDTFVIENNENATMSFVSATSGTVVLRFIRDGSTDTRGFLQYSHATDLLQLGAAGATRITAGSSGVGVGNNSPNQPLIVGVSGSGTGGNGAHVTAGGVWTNGSSRTFKDHIEELSASDALAAVGALKPVRYNYRAEPNEEYVGFIAEDVPDLVAQTSTDRKYLSPMDVVATLTKVVQEQQKTIDLLSKRLEQLEKDE